VGPAAPLSNLTFDGSIFNFDSLPSRERLAQSVAPGWGVGKRCAAACHTRRETSRKLGPAWPQPLSRFRLQALWYKACARAAKAALGVMLFCGRRGLSARLAAVP